MKEDIDEVIEAQELLESLKAYPREMIDFWTVDNYRAFEKIFFKNGRKGEFFLESNRRQNTRVFTTIHVQLIYSNGKTVTTWFELTADENGEIKKQRLLDNSKTMHSSLSSFFYYLKLGLEHKDWKFAEDKNIVKTELMKYIKEIWKKDED